MRTIKFRGKIIYHDALNGEWWKGDLRNTVSGRCFISSPRKDGSSMEFEVDPATVGQFTGKQDKNGADIYEGDTVHAWDDGAEIGEGSAMSGAVEYSGAGFGLRDKQGRINHLWTYAEFFEVVGNIHDKTTKP